MAVWASVVSTPISPRTWGGCPGCGSRYYKAETLKVIEDEFRRIRLGAHAGTFLDQA